MNVDDAVWFHLNNNKFEITFINNDRKLRYFPAREHCLNRTQSIIAQKVSGDNSLDPQGNYPKMYESIKVEEFLERVIELSSNAKESINIERAK